MTNPSPAIAVETLERLLLKEQQCAEQLLTLIEQEYELLSNGNIDDLQPLVDEKNQRVIALQTASQQREQLLAQNGFEAGLTGVQDCLASLGNTEQAAALLEQLTIIAEKCQRTNTMSGRLVRQRQYQNRSALSILQGQNNLPTDTYTQQGTTDAPSAPRTLGKA